MTLLTDTKSVEALCTRLASSQYVTVDTEFMRETTFWPQLCVIQLAGAEEAAAIDVLAPGMDLTPVYDLMANKAVLKVFHAARQDLEIFHHLSGHLPDPIFDTQIAAMVCGFGEQVGYETLIAKTTKAQVDKSSRFTDWSLRPLSERQIQYAIADVTHLRPAYEKLHRKLVKTGREDWIIQEMEILNSPATYIVEPDEAFRRIKSRGAKPRQLAILREVAAWREREAQHRDTPRNRVLRDESLIEISHHHPATTDQLGRTRGLGKRMAEGSSGAKILAAVKRGQAVADADCPQPQRRQELPRGLGPVTDFLKVLLKMKCEQFEVAPKLLASSSDIEKIAAFGEKTDVRAMSGWRLEVFGTDALKIRNGQMAIAIDGKKLRLVEIAQSETQ